MFKYLHAKNAEKFYVRLECINHDVKKSFPRVQRFLYLKQNKSGDLLLESSALDMISKEIWIWKGIPFN